VTTPHTIPIFTVSGSHRDVGLQMGDAAAGIIREDLDAAWDDLPAGRSREDQLKMAAEYRAFTAPRLPWLMEELDACAEGAGVDPLELFACSIEEIWYEPRPPRTVGRCSDLVAGPSATADGHLLVGHTNDLRQGSRDRIVAIEKRVTGDPVVLQLGGVPVLSVGFNSAGLALTGNELSPNDEQLGISRDLQVLEMIRARSLQEMTAMALRPDRASSYNNVLTSAEGGVANVEGSATDAEVTGLDDQGHLVHTNHYVCDRMLPFEGDPDYAERSQTRYDRAREMLADHGPRTITMDDLRTMLADHEGAPDSICRHPAEGSTTETAFWCIADVTDGVVRFGRGNPCDSAGQEYRFADYAALSAA
jgi:isopenicillin-N N-acyltransferase like protein